MTPRRSLEELADQHEIEQLMYRYATGIDTADYELVDSVFTADGEVDYAGIGGPRGRWHPEVRQWSEESLAAFPVRKHYITNVVVTFAADRSSATSVTYWRSPMGFARPDGSVHLFEPGGRYVDQLVCTDAGWRIAVRITMQDWMWGTLPAELTGADAPAPRTM
jgi:SnoaL-like domain